MEEKDNLGAYYSDPSILGGADGVMSDDGPINPAGLEQLEEIGNGFEGVEKTFAMQAGREVRVMVKPEEVDDTQSYKIAREMKEKIEKEMQYPGTIKITVIRETRAQEEAR